MLVVGKSVPVTLVGNDSFDALAVSFLEAV
jgi:hypothetical protein